MPYITTSNSKRIVRTLSEIKLNEIEIEVYKKEIYFLNNKERSVLKGIREFLRDPENFSTQYYKPLEVLDSGRYVYPENKPAYHKDSSCERLQMNFINFEIPVEIREKGPEQIKIFRTWFAENKGLLESDLKQFIFRLQATFRLNKEINPKSIDYSNSGAETVKNFSLKELEDQIDEILRAASNYFNSNPDKQHIIKRFGKLTFLAYTHGDIYSNESGLNDADLKDFLKMYDQKFKKPVKDYLVEYYRLLHNPDMTFSGTLLDKLNFRPCGHCMKENRVSKEDLFGSEEIEVADKDNSPKSILEILNSDTDLAIQLISLYYPLSKKQISDNWNILVTGGAHYPVYVSDTETVYNTQLGLCFNRNLEWTDELRSKWNVGFDNPFEGYTEGTGGAPVEFDEKKSLSKFLPLDVIKSIDTLNACIIEHWSSVIAPFQDRKNTDEFEGPFQYEIEKYKSNIPELGFAEFLKLYESDKLMISWNESIWKNTLEKIFTTEIVNKILSDR